MREPISDAHAEERMRDAEKSGDRFTDDPQAAASTGSTLKGDVLGRPSPLPGTAPTRPQPTQPTEAAST